MAERERLRVRPQRRLETLTEQLGRMRVVHQARDGLGDLPDGGVGRGEGRSAARRLDGAGRLLQRVEERVDGRDRAADVLVQLAGEAAALGVEHLQHALAELALRRLHLRALGDVARDAEDVDLAGDVETREADLAREERAVLAQRPHRQHHARTGRQGGDRLAVEREREVGIHVGDGHVLQLVPASSRRARGRAG